MKSTYGLKRTLISSTSDGAIIDNFYTSGIGEKFIGVVEKSNVVQQTLSTEILPPSPFYKGIH